MPPLDTLTNASFMLRLKTPFDLFELFDLRVVSACCINVFYEPVVLDCVV